MLAALSLFAAGRAGADDTVYHQARTPAELAVKRLMDIEDRDGDWSDALLGRGPSAAAYRAHMTPALFSNMARQHRAELARNCHGKTKGDGYCSFDFDPIECTDAGGEPRFRTLQQGKTSAVVGYTWGDYTDDAAQFRMILSRGEWQMDGIDCRHFGTKFNWK